MYCPECGNDAGSAKFCPECGANLAGVQDALKGKSDAAVTKASGSTGAAASASSAFAPSASASGGPKRLSPAVIWGGFGALAVVVIVIVVMVSGGFGGDSGDSTANASNAPVQAVTADTSGSYEQLIARANDIYDQGDAAFQKQDFEQGGAYFAAAAKIYRAAWAKQQTDPGVGTDYSVALFYSGDIAGALKQIDSVIKANPDFQKGWLNKGIFLSHEARIADQQGDKKTADKYNAQAKQALTKAVAIDPKSDAGKQADQSLQQLQQ
jgi:tetratricopeptide (TPR) repeat protein